MNKKEENLMYIEEQNELYNPEQNLLKIPFTGAHYHSVLKTETTSTVHPIFPSSRYAYALLESQVDAYLPRACDLLEKIISLQDTDRSRSTFGIWSYYYEESLDQMAPPDWNMADFNGKKLLLSVKRHGHRLPEALKAKLKQTLYHVSDAIITRDVGPSYTNIAVMGAFVTLVTGEVFGEQAYVDYGLARLERFYNYTMGLGTFEEYNSPTYTPITIEELHSIYTETSLPKAKQLSEKLIDIAWKCIADHYHPGTRQWSGPNSRAYHTLLDKEALTFIDNAIRPLAKGEVEDDRIRCPEPYVSRFLAADERMIRELVRDDTVKQDKRWATTYMNEKVSLGTFSKEYMWNQRRNLLAYIANGGESAYIQLKVLHNFKDFSSAVFTCVQNKFNALIGINFATNGGSWHPNLDIINGRMEASDLRIRFEIGGNLSQVVVAPDAATEVGEAGTGSRQIVVQIGKYHLTVQNLLDIFEGKTHGWSILEAEGKRFVDFVLYSGENRQFDFHEMDQAALSFALAISDSEHRRVVFQPEVKIQEDKSEITLRVNEEPAMAITVLMKPDTLQTLFQGNQC
jgi:hypothetical protein